LSDTRGQYLALSEDSAGLGLDVVLFYTARHNAALPRIGNWKNWYYY